MRHQKKRHKLGRTAAHRKATLASLASALIEHKRIETTLPKAKALRAYVEPLITRAKEDSTHNRREAFRHLQSKEAVTELFGDVAAQVGDRPGGYTRVIKLGQRLGDSAEMAVVELVDWNDVQPEGTGGAKKRTRRSGRTRRGGNKPAQPTQEKAQPTPPPAPNPSGPVATGEGGSGDPAPAAQEPSTGKHDASKTPPNPEENKHPDKNQGQQQGAAPGTGEPSPEFGIGDQGVGGSSRHRG